MKINKNWTPKEFCTGIINPATGKEWILSDYYEDKKGNRYFTHDEALEIWKQIPGWGPCTDEFHKALAKLVWDEWADDWCEDVLGPVLNGFEYMRQKLGYELGGFRPKDNNVLSNVGYCGDSWSSAMSGIYSQYLHLSPENLKPSDISLPEHGLQLRCLREK